MSADVPAPSRRISWSSFLGQEVTVLGDDPELGEIRFEVLEMALSSGAWARAATDHAQLVWQGTTGGDILRFGQFDGIGWWEWQAAILERGAEGRLRVGPPEGLSRRDRRSYRRVTVEIALSLTWSDGPDVHSVPGRTTNVSVGGMAAAFPAIDLEGIDNAVVLLQPPAYAPVSAVASVNGTTPTGEWRFEFVQMIESQRDALEVFVSTAMASGAANAWAESVERRQTSRYEVAVPVHVYVPSPNGHDVILGFTRDLGKGGAAIETDSALPEAGSSIAIELMFPDDRVLFAARVVSLAGGLIRLAFAEGSAENPVLRDALERGSVLGQ